MYRVIKTFADKQDSRYLYNVGDIYPREGLKVSERRIEELATDQNKRGIPLIEEVEEEEFMNKPVEEPEKVEEPEAVEEPEKVEEPEIKEEAVEPEKEEPEKAPKKRGRKKNASNTD